MDSQYNGELNTNIQTKIEKYSIFPNFRLEDHNRSKTLRWGKTEVSQPQTLPNRMETAILLFTSYYLYRTYIQKWRKSDNSGYVRSNADQLKQRQCQRKALRRKDVTHCYTVTVLLALGFISKAGLRNIAPNPHKTDMKWSNSCYSTTLYK